MHNHSDAFSNRKPACQQRVEDNGEADDGDRKQRAVPGFCYVAFVVEYDKALYDGADHEADAC